MFCFFLPLLFFFFPQPVIFSGSVRSVRGRPVRQDSAGAFGICSYQHERSALQSLQGGGEEGPVPRQGSMKGRAGKKRTDKAGCCDSASLTTRPLPPPMISPLESSVW